MPMVVPSEFAFNQCWLKIQSLSMCAQFMIRATLRKLALKYGIPLPADDLGSKARANDEAIVRVLPQGKAPVVLSAAGAPVLMPMQFALLPRWSKTRRVKFATHNARLESPPDAGGPSTWV